MRGKIITVLTAVLLLLSSSGNAAKIDIYRDALANRSYTIRYEIVQPPISGTEKYSYAEIYEDEFIDRTDSKFNVKPYNGLVVGSGDESYSERVYGVQQTRVKNRVSGNFQTQNVLEHGNCILTKNGEKFYFAFEVKDGKRKYYGSYNSFGSKSSKVKADENQTMDIQSMRLPPLQRLVDEYKFGSPDLARVLTPILPPDKIIATIDTPNYKFIRSGYLNNGLTYEDFSAKTNNTFYAVRYYFNGDQLTKIAYIDYTRNGNAIVDFNKSVVEIIEFTNTPDNNYLSLPSELKDKTKRDKEASK